MERGEYGFIIEAEKHTLAELIEHYLKTEQNPGARESCLDWWKEEIGHLKLSQVTPALFSELKVKLQNGSSVGRVKQRSFATVNRYLAYLSTVFTKAVKEYQWCKENPLLKVSRLKEPRGRVRFHDVIERNALLSQCREDQMLYELVVLALTTGARVGELLRLDWKDIDFESGTAILRETKNGEARSIPVRGEIKGLLNARRGFGPVFYSKSGKAKYEYSKPFIKAVNAADIEDFRFHDLRHSAASYMAQNGLSLLEIAHVLGHKSITMTQRYSHLCTDTVTRAGDMLNDIVFES